MCDFVMYWWHNAAHLVSESKVNRFGFIATNSVRQSLNRRVLNLYLDAKNPLSIRFCDS